MKPKHSKSTLRGKKERQTLGNETLNLMCISYTTKNTVIAVSCLGSDKKDAKWCPNKLNSSFLQGQLDNLKPPKKSPKAKQKPHLRKPSTQELQRTAGFDCGMLCVSTGRPLCLLCVFAHLVSRDTHHMWLPSRHAHKEEGDCKPNSR